MNIIGNKSSFAIQYKIVSVQSNGMPWGKVIVWMKECTLAIGEMSRIYTIYIPIG